MLMEGKSVEEILEFMDNNDHSLLENPFERRTAKAKVEEKADDNPVTENQAPEENKEQEIQQEKPLDNDGENKE